MKNFVMYTHISAKMKGIELSKINLQEFCELVVDASLTNSTIKKKWDNFCDNLKELSAEEVSEIIHEGFLDQFLDYEANDGFGTEGMKL